MTNNINWSDEIFRIYGYKPQEFQPTYEWFVEKVHHDDRESVVKSMDMALTENKLFNIDFRVVRQDGSIRYVNMVADRVRTRPFRQAKMVVWHYAGYHGS